MYKTIKRILKNNVSENNFLYKNFRFLRRRIRSSITLRPLERLRIEVHIVDHCNLNCISCNHFSPIAEKFFLDITDFEHDCSRISELTKKVEYFNLLGGEPLLHPQIIDFCKVARKYFENGTINIITNGILLPKQPEEFWHTCRTNNIRIIITRYPVAIDIQKIEKKALESKVILEYWPADNILKTMLKVPFDISGRQNSKNNYKICGLANACIQLRHGKIYTCSVIAYIDYFNRYFNKNLKATEKDYIDIYKVKNIDEIYSFLCKPMPFCRYCNIKKIVYGIGWSVSKKQITEWT
jgi:MoaA/NifB/PqqE/SkfB family radical SAM enzyme